MTDQDTAVTLVEIDATRRIVWHYGPDFYAPPLTALENLVDEVTGTKHWTQCLQHECVCRHLGDAERDFVERRFEPDH